MPTTKLPNVLRVEDPNGGPTFYLGTFTPRDIKQLTFVPVVTESMAPNGSRAELLNEQPGGYQRAGDVARMKKIKEFVIERSSCVIPPVLLCARGKWRFSPLKGNVAFGDIEAEDLAAIIDGQHRLGGLWRIAVDAQVPDALKSRPIPFMALEDLDLHGEQLEFVDINGNQKGVKKSLLRYLDRDESFAGQAAQMLRIDEESVFCGRIDIQKKHDWDLVLFGAVQECILLMFGTDLKRTKKFDPHTNESSREAALDFVLQYWKLVRESFHEYWSDMDKMPALNGAKSATHPGTSKFEYRLLEETGIRAFSRLAERLFRVTWNDALHRPSFEAVSEYLKMLALSDRVRTVLTKPSRDPRVLQLDPDLKSSGKAGVDAMYRHLGDELDSIMRGT